MSAMFDKIESIDGEYAKPHKHPGCFVIDKGTSAYKEGAVVRGKKGTVVPIMSLTGGIDGSDNPYGLVKQGNVVSKDANGEELIKGKVQLAKEIVGEVKEVVEEIAVIQEVKKPPRKRKVTEVVEEVIEAVEVPVKVAGKKVVTLVGNFGSYRGKYNDVYKEGNLLVLLYSLDDNSFSPPADMNSPIEVRCGDKVYTVYYPGIEFSISKYNIGVQVMLFNEDKE